MSIEVLGSSPEFGSSQKDISDSMRWLGLWPLVFAYRPKFQRDIFVGTFQIYSFKAKLRSVFDFPICHVGEHGEGNITFPSTVSESKRADP